MFPGAVDPGRAMERQRTPGWDQFLERRARWMQVLGRFRPGVTAQEAQAGLQPWFKSMRLATSRERTNGGVRKAPPAAMP
jgi:hypothetical protein